MVGVIGLFFWPSPILMKQGYLILTGCIVAYVFTWIPEWTTWTLLVMMALYDLCAVLTPGGPLKARRAAASPAHLPRKYPASLYPMQRFLSTCWVVAGRQNTNVG